MDNHIFRGAALGFNRQDVMEYIEKVQRDAEARIAELAAQLDEVRQECDASRQALEDCAQERDRLGDELADLKERYEAEQSARSTAETESAQQKNRLRDLESENIRLTGQVDEMKRRMGDLRREKERLTQLELDAHQRSDELLAQTQTQADEILAAADVKAANIQAEAQTLADVLLSETRRQIQASVERSEGLLRSCESVAAHVSSELQKIDVAVTQLPVGLDSLKRGLAELLDQQQDK